MTIESARIPIIDPANNSLWASVQELFNGFYYYGDYRYHIIPTNDTTIIKLMKVQGDHLLSTVLKIILYVTGVAPLIGLACYLYNRYHQAHHQFQIVDETRYQVPIPTPPLPKQDPPPPPPPQPKKVPPPQDPLPPPSQPKQDPPPQDLPSSPPPFKPALPTAELKPSAPPAPKKDKVIPIRSTPGLSFSQCLPSNMLFGDYTLGQWEQMFEDYKKSRPNQEEFLCEMLVFKRDLLNWKPKPRTGEKNLKINKNTFIEDRVPELMTVPLSTIFSTKNMQRIEKERDIEQVIELLIQARIKANLTAEDLDFQLHFINKLKTQTYRQNFFLELIRELSPQKLSELVQLLKKRSETDESLYIFLSTFVKCEEASENRVAKIKEVFKHFWDRWEDPVTSRLGRFKFLQALLYEMRDDELAPLLETVPKTLDESKLKDIANDAVSMIRSKGTNLSKLKDIVKGNDLLGKYVA